MKAITLWQPWAYAICHLVKRVENRRWSPPTSLIGQRIALHAGARLDREALEFLRHEGYAVPNDVPHKAIVAVATLASVATWQIGAVPTEHRRWYCGPYGWVLSAVTVLAEPIPCNGAQGLWAVPEAIEKQIGAM